MKFSSLVLLASSLIGLSSAAPVIITRMHTAEAVTVVETNYFTVTRSIPIVEVIISGAQTYTETLFTLEPTVSTEGKALADIVPRTTTIIAPTSTDCTTTIGTTANAVVVTEVVNVTATDVTENTSTNAPAAPAQDPTTATPVAAAAPTTTSTTPATAAPTTTSTTPAAPATTPTTTSTKPVTTPTTTSTTPDAPATTSTTTHPGAIVTNVATTSSPAANPATTTSTSTTSTETPQSTGEYIGDENPSAVSSVIPTGIVYSPYNDDSTCKTYDQVQTDLNLINSRGISIIRVYGNDCNYLTTVLPIAQSLGLKVNQGFWISDAGVDSIDTYVTQLISAISSGENGLSWDIFEYFTIGNEAIISGYCTVDELISKIAQVKSLLKAGGYTGKVTTSEPPVTFEQNPSLCTDSDIDFVGINSHAYFDTYSSAETAGTFVAGQISLIEGYCPNLDVIVTETGYPSAGITNGGNVPSVANQKIAIANLLKEVGSNMILLSTYNDLWKDPGAYGIEQSFGIIQLID